MPEMGQVLPKEIDLYSRFSRKKCDTFKEEFLRTKRGRPMKVAK
jgi:hypothetical protein